VKANGHIPRSSVRPVRWILIAALAWVIIPAAASARPEIASHWRDREITVDGQDAEWSEARTYVKDAKMSIAAFNDDEYLYLCIMTNDQQVLRQAMMQGLTIWLDPDGGKDKEFGVRFPIGMRGDPSMRVPMPQEAEPDTAEFHERFGQATTEIEIIGPEKDQTRRMPVNAVVGIDATLNMLPEGFVYELRIPLVQTDDHPFAVGIDRTDEIGLGVEIPAQEFDRSKMERPQGMGGRGGFGGGPPGGMGGRGGPGGGSMPERPKPVDTWCKMKLAANPGAATDLENSSE